MEVVNLKCGRWRTVVFSRDERGREHRVDERDVARSTSIQPRLAAAPIDGATLRIRHDAGTIAYAIDDQVELRVTSGLLGQRVCSASRRTRTPQLSPSSPSPSGLTTCRRSAASSKLACGERSNSKTAALCSSSAPYSRYAQTVPPSRNAALDGGGVRFRGEPAAGRRDKSEQTLTRLYEVAALRGQRFRGVLSNDRTGTDIRFSSCSRGGRSAQTPRSAHT